MRLERENDMLAQQLLTRQITMRAEIDKLEDMIVKKGLVERTEEKTMLAEEADQLKLVLKREVDRMETELRVKENIITDYKKITAQLSSKVEKLQSGDKEEAGSSDLYPVTASNPLTSALDRVKELELELAQTKLALVETECKNQDLTHQFNQNQASSGPQSNTWFTKTLSSIKEVAGAKGTKPGQPLQSPTDSLKKSVSEQVLGSL